MVKSAQMAAAGVATMALEKELETYKAKLSELTEHEGKFVLIKGDDVAGVYTSYDDALQEGYEKFGLGPFLVKQIHALEQVQFISRFLDPCSRVSA
jgi:hypothetical protein